MKTIFKHTGSRVWFIVTAVVLVLMILINVLTTTVLYGLISITPLGGDRPIIADGINRLYVPEAASKEDALERANNLNIEINKEGEILLKNEGALPLEKGSSICVFGKNSVNLVYGGSGSGGIDDISKAKTIYDSLEAAGFSCNPTLRDFYNSSQSGSARDGNPPIESSGDVTLSTAETPLSMYTDAVKDSYSQYKDAALVVFSRIGGEGFDLPRTMAGASGARDESDHYLQLDANETALLDMVCSAGFEHVIVILNSSSPMELGFLDDPTHYAYHAEIDGCLWIGNPGTTGIMALGSILSGETNPSGRTVDTYARNFKHDPSWQNFGTNLMADGDAYLDSTARNPVTLNTFVEYEEGIYVGYRYYETRAVSYNGAIERIGETTYENGEAWYRDHVVYPFGYGLSYTTFEWKIVGTSELSGKMLADADKSTDFVIEVEVTNTGNYAGKDVVEIYCSAPYITGGIEKSSVVLCGFAKTDLIQPGESDTVEITFNPYDVASYDYADKNGNGFKGYELDGGEYALLVNRNAHSGTVNGVVGNVATIPFSVIEAGIRYEKDPVTEYTVENRYDDADDELEAVLSRADWVNTFPATPTEAERTKDSSFLNTWKDFTPNNPNANSYTTMPNQASSAVNSEITLRDMIDKDYDDEDWERLLDNIMISDMIHLYDYGAFNTAGISNIGKPMTIDADGPVGFRNFMGDSKVYDTCSYASECVLGATWNAELLYEMGQSVGEEGLWGDAKDSTLPYSGWYAPGVNIHRSQFGGRNFEYFSEDGHLTGTLAASEVSGALSKGVYAYVKHFALNDQETHRNGYGLYTWVTEQSMREIYLKPFEKAVKDGGAHGIMSSFNRIGTKWAGGDYRLLTEILRNEWGFQGMVICDFNTEAYMNSKQMAYAGGDLNLATVPYSWTDSSSAADVTVLRQCVKNILFTVANSNAVNNDIVGYLPAYWKIAMWVVDAVLAAGFTVWGVFAIRNALKDEKAQSDSTE